MTIHLWDCFPRFLISCQTITECSLNSINSSTIFQRAPDSPIDSFTADTEWNYDSSLRVILHILITNWLTWIRTVAFSYQINLSNASDTFFRGLWLPRLIYSYFQICFTRTVLGWFAISYEINDLKSEEVCEKIDKKIAHSFGRKKSNTKQTRDARMTWKFQRKCS